MIWLIYSDYFKKKEKITALMRELKWYKWITIGFLLLTTIIFIYYSFNYNNWLFDIGYILFALFSGIYIGYELKKIKITRYGTERNFYFRQLDYLKNILSDLGVTRIEQINILTNQIADIIHSLKVSEQILKPIKSIGVLVILPLFIWCFKEVATKSGNYRLAVLIFSLILTIIGLWLIIKVILEQILDNQYNNMKELKQSLEDVKIILLEEN